MSAEEWRNIDGFPHYMVSSAGRVRSVGHDRWHPGRVRKLRLNEHGYRTVSLYESGREHGEKVHRLVASAFIPNPMGLEQVNHRDFNRQNNAVENLEWCSRQDNMQHAYDAGRFGGDGKRIAAVASEVAQAIKAERRAGRPLTRFMSEYGISKTQVYRIARGESRRVAA